MNLQPVKPVRPDVRILCSECGTWTPTTAALADLDAKPGTYYCADCAERVQAHASRPETPREKLRHHVTGAIERGEAEAIEGHVECPACHGATFVEAGPGGRGEDCPGCDGTGHVSHTRAAELRRMIEGPGYATECPDCGGPLELAYAQISTRGAMITRDGFALVDAAILDTWDEEARCIDCRELFTLDGKPVE